MLELLLIWTALSGFVAYWASTQGRSAGVFFVIALLASPLVAAIILTMRTRRKQKRSPLHIQAPQSSCPYCDAQVRRQALLCHSCGRDLQKFHSLRHAGLRSA